MAHRSGSIHLTDLDFTSASYRPFKAYGQSKLANVLFTKELARREAAAGTKVTTYSLHPGKASLP